MNRGLCFLLVAVIVFVCSCETKQQPWNPIFEETAAASKAATQVDITLLRSLPFVPQKHSIYHGVHWQSQVLQRQGIRFHHPRRRYRGWCVLHCWLACVARGKAVCVCPCASGCLAVVIGVSLRSAASRL